MTEREQERAAIVKYMQDAIGQGYPWPRGAARKCEHGRYNEFEDCIACYDEFLIGKLEEILAGAHLSQDGEG